MFHMSSVTSGSPDPHQILCSALPPLHMQDAVTVTYRICSYMLVYARICLYMLVYAYGSCFVGFTAFLWHPTGPVQPPHVDCNGHTHMSWHLPCFDNYQLSLTNMTQQSLHGLRSLCSQLNCQDKFRIDPLTLIIQVFSHWPSPKK